MIISTPFYQCTAQEGFGILLDSDHLLARSSSSTYLLGANPAEYDIPFWGEKVSPDDASKGEHHRCLAIQMVAL